MVVQYGHTEALIEGLKPEKCHMWVGNYNIIFAFTRRYTRILVSCGVVLQILIRSLIIVE